MNALKFRTAFGAVAMVWTLSLGLSPVVHAQEKMGDMKAAQPTMTDGEVRKVDKDAKKITIKTQMAPIA